MEQIRYRIILVCVEIFCDYTKWTEAEETKAHNCFWREEGRQGKEINNESGEVREREVREREVREREARKRNKQ